jgi:hypothetical protein
MAAAAPPMVQEQQYGQPPLAGSSGNSNGGQPSGLSPDRNIVCGYDIESLVDAALGKVPMPSAPLYLDAFGQPLTRIVHVIPTPAATVPALTTQQQQAINALSTAPVTSIPALTPQQEAAINLLPPLPSFGGGGAVQHAAGGQQQELSAIPTRVLVLLNMVTDDDLVAEDDYAGLVEEIKEECAKFGLLRNIKVPRGAGGGVEASAVRKVFLEYATAEDASKAER